MITESLAQALDGLVDAAPPPHRDRAQDARWAFEAFVTHDATRSGDWTGAQITIRDSVTGLLGDALVPLVIEPLFALAESGISEPEWVAMRIATALQTAASWLDGEPARRVLGHDVQRRVDAHGEKVLTWLGGPLEGPAILIARRLPSLQRPLVDGLTTLPAPHAWGLLALAALPPIPPTAFAGALDALQDAREERRVAAAVLLQRHPALDDALAARIGDVLGPSAGERWASLCGLLDCPLLPVPTARFRGDMEDAEVLFVGARSTTVRRAGGLISTISVALPGVVKGARVRVGISPQGIVRAIEHGWARLDLDLRGRPLA